MKEWPGDFTWLIGSQFLSECLPSFKKPITDKLINSFFSQLFVKIGRKYKIKEMITTASFADDTESHSWRED